MISVVKSEHMTIVKEKQKGVKTTSTGKIENLWARHGKSHKVAAIGAATVAATFGGGTSTILDVPKDSSSSSKRFLFLDSSKFCEFANGGETLVDSVLSVAFSISSPSCLVVILWASSYEADSLGISPSGNGGREARKTWPCIIRQLKV
jgi:hypothetical protein